MTAIHTVLGPRPPAEVGRILPHEHLLCDFSPVSGLITQVLSETALAVDELAALEGTGIGCLFEVTTPDLGRNPQGLVDIARRSGVHVVMATGWYRESFLPEVVTRSTPSALAEIMIHELTEGVELADGTRVRAGIIGEIGIERDFLTAREERVLRAAARASNATGCPITTHGGVHPVGLLQWEILREEGVDPERIIIGHADMHLDADYHRALLRAGLRVQFDTAGRTHLNPDARRAEALATLVREGWADRLLISSDRCFKTDLLAFGGVGYAHTLTGFANELRAAGLDQDVLDELTITNPQTALAW